MAFVKKRSVMDEVSRCLLCYEAPCTASCPAGRTPDRIIRALVFDNEAGAMHLNETQACVANCQCACMKACIRGKIDTPLHILSVYQYLTEQSEAMTPQEVVV